MEFKFEGLDQLITSLERMEDDAEKGKKEALEAGADIMQKSAKSLARKRTGNLVEHIEKSEVEGDEIQVYVDNQGPAYYGHMLELENRRKYLQHQSQHQRM